MYTRNHARHHQHVSDDGIASQSSGNRSRPQSGSTHIRRGKEAGDETRANSHNNNTKNNKNNNNNVNDATVTMVPYSIAASRATCSKTAADILRPASGGVHTPLQPDRVGSSWNAQRGIDAGSPDAGTATLVMAAYPTWNNMRSADANRSKNSSRPMTGATTHSTSAAGLTTTVNSRPSTADTRATRGVISASSQRSKVRRGKEVLGYYRALEELNELQVMGRVTEMQAALLQTTPANDSVESNNNNKDASLIKEPETTYVSLASSPIACPRGDCRRPTSSPTPNIDTNHTPTAADRAAIGTQQQQSGRDSKRNSTNAHVRAAMSAAHRSRQRKRMTDASATMEATEDTRSNGDDSDALSAVSSADYESVASCSRVPSLQSSMTSQAGESRQYHPFPPPPPAPLTEEEMEAIRVREEAWAEHLFELRRGVRKFDRNYNRNRQFPSGTPKLDAFMRELVASQFDVREGVINKRIGVPGDDVFRPILQRAFRAERRRQRDRNRAKAVAAGGDEDQWDSSTSSTEDSDTDIGACLSRPVSAQGVCLSRYWGTMPGATKKRVRTAKKKGMPQKGSAASSRITRDEMLEHAAKRREQLLQEAELAGLTGEEREAAMRAREVVRQQAAHRRRAAIHHKVGLMDNHVRQTLTKMEQALLSAGTCTTSVHEASLAPKMVPADGPGAIEDSCSPSKASLAQTRRGAADTAEDVEESIRLLHSSMLLVASQAMPFQVPSSFNASPRRSPVTKSPSVTFDAHSAFGAPPMAPSAPTPPPHPDMPSAPSCQLGRKEERPLPTFSQMPMSLRMSHSLLHHKPLRVCVRKAARLIVFVLMRALPAALYDGDQKDFTKILQQEEVLVMRAVLAEAAAAATAGGPSTTAGDRSTVPLDCDSERAPTPMASEIAAELSGKYSPPPSESSTTSATLPTRASRTSTEVPPVPIEKALSDMYPKNAHEAGIQALLSQTHRSTNNNNTSRVPLHAMRKEDKQAQPQLKKTKDSKKKDNASYEVASVLGLRPRSSLFAAILRWLQLNPRDGAGGGISDKDQYVNVSTEERHTLLRTIFTMRQEFLGEDGSAPGSLQHLLKLIQDPDIPAQVDSTGRPTGLDPLLVQSLGGFGIAPFSGAMFHYMQQHREFAEYTGGDDEALDGAPVSKVLMANRLLQPEPALLPLMSLTRLVSTATARNSTLTYRQAEYLLGPMELQLLSDLMDSFADLSFSFSKEHLMMERQRAFKDAAKGSDSHERKAGIIDEGLDDDEIWEDEEDTITRGGTEMPPFFFETQRGPLLEWCYVVITEAAIGYAMDLAGSGIADFSLVSYASTDTLTEEQIDTILESPLPSLSMPNVPFSRLDRQVAYSVIEKNRGAVLESIVRLKGELYYLLTGIDQRQTLLTMHNLLLEDVRQGYLMNQKLSRTVQRQVVKAPLLSHPSIVTSSEREQAVLEPSSRERGRGGLLTVARLRRGSSRRSSVMSESSYNCISPSRRRLTISRRTSLAATAPAATSPSTVAEGRNSLVGSPLTPTEGSGFAVLASADNLSMFGAATASGVATTRSSFRWGNGAATTSTAPCKHEGNPLAEKKHNELPTEGRKVRSATTYRAHVVERSRSTSASTSSSSRTRASSRKAARRAAHSPARLRLSKTSLQKALVGVNPQLRAPSHLMMDAVVKSVQELEDARVMSNRSNALLTGQFYERGVVRRDSGLLPVFEDEDVAKLGLPPAGEGNSPPSTPTLRLSEAAARRERAAGSEVLHVPTLHTSTLTSGDPPAAAPNAKKKGSNKGAGGGNGEGGYCPQRLLDKYQTFILDDHRVQVDETPQVAAADEQQKLQAEPEPILTSTVIPGVNPSSPWDTRKPSPRGKEKWSLRRLLRRHSDSVDVPKPEGKKAAEDKPQVEGKRHTPATSKKKMESSWYTHGRPGFEEHRLESKLRRLRPCGEFDMYSVSPLVALKVCVNDHPIATENTVNKGSRPHSPSSPTPPLPLRTNPFTTGSYTVQRVKRSGGRSTTKTTLPLPPPPPRPAARKRDLSNAAQQSTSLYQRGLRMGQSTLPWTV